MAAPPPNLAAVFSLGSVLTFLAHSSGCTQYPHGNTDHLISSSTCTISLNPTGNKATLLHKVGAQKLGFAPSISIFALALRETSTTLKADRSP